MALDPFALEQLRLRVAGSLPANCFDDFQRLSRTLLHGPAFQWLLVDAPNEALRKQVMAALDEVLHAAGLNVNRLPLSGKIDDVPALEARLVNNAGKAQVVHVVGRPGWFTAARWDAFNARRERIAEKAQARLVFWLDGSAIELASRGAPDLWSWRAGVYAFLIHAEPAADPEATLAPSGRRSSIDTRSIQQRQRRMAEIRDWLQAHPGAPDDLLVAPLDELGLLLYEAGDFDRALALWREHQLPLHRRRGDEHAVATTQGRIADVLEARGQLDEALRIRRHEELAAYGRLGDLYSRAVTQGKIADVLETRGQLEEALRIRREEELPVYEKLGALRARAITQGKISDVLQVRGQLDEALRILREEVLPVFEQLGDVRSRALTHGRIADVLQARGQLDEALRIRREEELPVYEKLGDVHSRAVTQGQIADVLQARGQLDEALRIRREDQLPVYERLGDVRARAVTQWKIALQLLDQSPPQRQEAQALLTAACTDLQSMGLPEAEKLARQMRQLGLTLPDAPPTPP